MGKQPSKSILTVNLNVSQVAFSLHSDSAGTQFTLSNFSAEFNTELIFLHGGFSLTHTYSVYCNGTISARLRYCSLEQKSFVWFHGRKAFRRSFEASPLLEGKGKSIIQVQKVNLISFHTLHSLLDPVLYEFTVTIKKWIFLQHTPLKIIKGSLSYSISHYSSVWTTVAQPSMRCLYHLWHHKGMILQTVCVITHFL